MIEVNTLMKRISKLSGDLETHSAYTRRLVEELIYGPSPATRSQNGGRNIWVQSTEPTAIEIGDIWIRTRL